MGHLSTGVPCCRAQETCRAGTASEDSASASYSAAWFAHSDGSLAAVLEVVVREVALRQELLRRLAPRVWQRGCFGLWCKGGSHAIGKWGNTRLPDVWEHLCALLGPLGEVLHGRNHLSFITDVMKTALALYENNLQLITGALRHSLFGSALSRPLCRTTRSS